MKRYLRYRNGRLAHMAVAIGCLLVVYLFLCFVPVSVANDALPFSTGERLTFQLSWTIIPAGEAVLEVMPGTMVNGKPAHHFRLTATSNAFVDMFYKVRDRIDAYADVEMTHALRYLHKQHEGDNRKNVRVEFDWEDEIARYFDGKKHKEVDLLPGTFDPLSIFYFTRMVEYETGGRIVCPVTDGKKCVYGEAHIIKKETIKVDAGTFDTYLIEPDLKHVGGVFEKDKSAKIRIWVTADTKRIPVKIASKVAVGSFVGELISIEKRRPMQAARSLPQGSPIIQ